MHTLPIRGAVLALALTSALAACSSAGQPANLHGHEVRLTLLHTADWHSRLFPYNQQVSQTDASLGLQQSRAPFGGAARMNWLIQRERAHSERVLHLDSGDCFQGAPIFNFFQGEAEVRALNLTGVDVAAVGNHEFDRGANNFYSQYSRWATFPVLAANYQFEDPNTPGSAQLGRLVHPYAMFNQDGLRVAVIGMGNLSSLTSLFDQPNRFGIVPLSSRETMQFYLDQLRTEGADVIVGLSHLGLTDDQDMIAQTTGLDVVLGGHLHIVLNPPEEIPDCQPTDIAGNHFVPEVDDGGVQRSTPCNPADNCCAAGGVCPPEPALGRNYWRLAPGFHARACHSRTVILQHSGAFMKYLGRLDLVLSDDPAQMGPGAGLYDSRDRFEVVGHRYTLFPVDSSVPEEPVMARMLEPYARALDTLANLDTLVGYAPNEVSRTATAGGDSPMGNLVSTAMWLRLGVQTDFALTNSLGIRDSIPPGPVAVDQIFNVFPFDNSITTMFLSGREVREMFDFVSRRSSGRGCNSQAQIAGARVVIHCGACDRDGVPGPDTMAGEGGVQTPITACAETINIGLTRTTDENNQPIVGVPDHCDRDTDCYAPETAPERRSLCEPRAHRCMQPLSLDASYALAANNYIAAGGSGFFVLQRNTTQVDTGVQQRDAVIDHVRAGDPCGYSATVAADYRARHAGSPVHADDGLTECSVDTDCNSVGVAGDYSCACSERVSYDEQMRLCSANNACPNSSGRCVLRRCADDVAALAAQDCPTAVLPQDAGARERCLCAAQSRGAASCRILACFDERVGAVMDNRLQMVSQ